MSLRWVGARFLRVATSAFAAMVLVACGRAGDQLAVGADLDRPVDPAMERVVLTDVAAEVGLDFRHGAFQWGTTGDPAAMMGGGVCWLDVDADGWLDLFVVNTWSDGEWGRWREEGALPSTQLFRNDRGRFSDVTEEWAAGLEVRGNGCVAADLDRDGHTDLYVTTERDNVLLWNDDGDRFEADDGTAGANLYGWQSGAAVGDVDRDGWPDLFVAGYADLNHQIPTDKGFPNPFAARPDFLLMNGGAEDGRRPTFTDVAAEVGIEADQLDYGLGAVFADIDRDGDLDLHVANDTQPNRLYLNEAADDADGPGFRFREVGAQAGIDDDNAGMGVAIADYDGDGRNDVAVTNLASQGHVVFRGVDSDEPPEFTSALESMGQPDLGIGETGWGTSWADLDLDGDLDLLLAHGAVPVRDVEADRQQLRAFENLTVDGRPGAFVDATTATGLDESGWHLARGLAGADYDNDGDVDFAVGTIGGHLALLRNTGAGGHWLLVAPEPALPGTRVTVTDTTGMDHERELVAGSSYLSSEDPRAHFGLGSADRVTQVVVEWPDGTVTVVDDVDGDQVLRVERP
jgi:hypothetical protein